MILSHTVKTRKTFSKKNHTFLKKSDYVLTNEVLMTFSMCGSYHKDTCDYDECIYSYIYSIYSMC